MGKKPEPVAGLAQCMSIPEQPLPQLEDYAEREEHIEPLFDSRIPVCVGSIQVTHGGQLEATFGDVLNMNTLVQGAQDESLRSSGSRPQTRTKRQQQSPVRVEQSGFNPHPRKGPCRPPPLIKPKNRHEHERGGTQPREAIASSLLVKPETRSADSPGGTMRRVLAAKDVNQKVRTARDQDRVAYFSQLSESCKVERRRQSKKLAVDERESPRYPDRTTERIASPAEEPTPLTIRKDSAGMCSVKVGSSSATPEHRSMLGADRVRGSVVHFAVESASSGSAYEKLGRHLDIFSDESYGQEGIEMDEAKDEVRSLLEAITEQLPAFSMRQRQVFEDYSAVPKPLDLVAIKAGKEKRKLSILEASSQEGSGAGGRVVSGGPKMASVGVSPKNETESMADHAERTRTRWRWYKGLGRSGW